ncbi:MAG: hypothetical protein HRT89_19660 [Lentisphaeria bacterium]|nr:hypothetical protein [Lentisphaeria bacterium]
MIINDLPEIYKNLLPSIFHKTAISETLSTCDNCAMLCSSKKPSKEESKAEFNQTFKCCTYHPDIPNFLVGGILYDMTDEITDGKQRIIKAIESKISSRPNGVYAPNNYVAMYSSGDAFGHADSMGCPFYNKQNSNCSIWKYRDSVCSTWFCKYQQNDLGQIFWNDVEEYLAEIQSNLVDYILIQLGFSTASIMTFKQHGHLGFRHKILTSEEQDSLPMSEEDYNKTWGTWAGREIELYKSSYDIVANMSKSTLRSINGVESEFYENKIQSSYLNKNMLPPILKLNTLKKSNVRPFKKEGLDFIEISLFNDENAKHLPVKVQFPASLVEKFNGTKPWSDVINNSSFAPRSI